MQSLSPESTALIHAGLMDFSRLWTWVHVKYLSGRANGEERLYVRMCMCTALMLKDPDLLNDNTWETSLNRIHKLNWFDLPHTQTHTRTHTHTRTRTHKHTRMHSRTHTHTHAHAHTHTLARTHAHAHIHTHTHTHKHTRAHTLKERQRVLFWTII